VAEDDKGRLVLGRLADAVDPAESFFLQFFALELILYI
jgi:hypothetical protein